MVDGRQTFGKMGLVFPLFEAPVDQCASFVGNGTCSVFRQPDDHCFIVDSIAVACADCGFECVVDAGEPATAVCEGCQAPLGVLPNSDGDLVASYRAIATARAFFCHDTEFGTLDARALFNRNSSPEKGRPESPKETITLGNGFVMVDRKAGDDERIWEVSQADLEQLLATPEYGSWQQPIWLLHCKAPMIYEGSGDLTTITALPDDLRNRIVDDICDLYGQEPAFPDGSTVHYFACRRCGIVRPHIDYP